MCGSVFRVKAGDLRFRKKAWVQLLRMLSEPLCQDVRRDNGDAEFAGAQTC